MSKQKATFFCQNCGNETPKWEGKCSACGEWNTIQEFKITKSKRSNSGNVLNKNKPRHLNDISVDVSQRLSSQNPELDAVLGGGLVPGALILLGGEPGVGKSTLTLQTALQMQGSVLYISGEESQEQIKLRADRLDGHNDELQILPETDLDSILHQIKQVTPQLLIVDSIQTLHWAELENNRGSVSQLKECTIELQKVTKELNIPVILIGHINKDGNIAGPKLVEHIVDVVLYFEGDKNDLFRILRSSKNRFGSTDEIGLFTMAEEGLKVVNNPSQMLINNRTDIEYSGCAVASTIEGKRSLLVEVQALVSPSIYSTPQRLTTGFDIRRLHMLLAVIEKRIGLQVSQQDVFLNIVGGMKVSDPALDLAVLAALISSHQDISIPRGVCFAGEIGLTGEVIPLSRVEMRTKEAKKMGYETMIHCDRNNTTSEMSTSISRVSELIPLLFSGVPAS